MRIRALGLMVAIALIGCKSAPTTSKTTKPATGPHPTATAGSLVTASSDSGTITKVAVGPSTQPATTPAPGTKVLGADALSSLRAKLKLIASAASSSLDAANVKATGGQTAPTVNSPVLSNNGGNVVSNNGGGVLSDHGSGLLGNNGASRRLLDVTALDPSQQAGETRKSKQIYLDGEEVDIYSTPTGARLAYTGADGKTLREKRSTSPQPSGDMVLVRELETDLFDLGEFGWSSDVETTYDQALKIQALAYKAGHLVDASTNAEVTIQDFSADLRTGEGTFTFAFPRIGVTDVGKLHHVTRGPTGGVTLALQDPLLINEGESEARDKDGQLIYTKRSTFEGAKHLLAYQLDEHQVLQMDVTTIDPPYSGQLLVDGEPAGAVVERTNRARQVAFELSLAGGKETVGATDDPPVTSSPVPSPAGPPPIYMAVDTMHFSGLPSPRVLAGKPGVFYMACTEAHQLGRVTYQVNDQGFTYLLEPFAGSSVAGSQDGQGTAAQFQGPQGLALADDGTLYVSDIVTHAIRKITPAGQVTTVLPGAEAGLADGPAGTARLNTPAGLAWDPVGVLYVADAMNHAIRAIDLSGAQPMVTTLAGNGTAGFADGPGADARFDQPVAVALDGKGGLFVSDANNHRIRKIDLTTPTHDVTTAAGNGDNVTIDGPAASASFRSPAQLAFSPQGGLWIPDLLDVVVRHVAPDGTVTTAVGNGSVGSTNGFMVNARFSGVSGVWIDPVSNLAFLADSLNKAIRVVVCNQATLP